MKKPLNKSDRATMRELASELLNSRGKENIQSIHDAMLEILENKPVKLRVGVRIGDTDEQAQRRCARIMREWRKYNDEV